jgi:hypothetical protein
LYGLENLIFFGLFGSVMLRALFNALAKEQALTCAVQSFIKVS